MVFLFAFFPGGSDMVTVSFPLGGSNGEKPLTQWISVARKDETSRVNNYIGLLGLGCLVFGNYSLPAIVVTGSTG